MTQQTPWWAGVPTKLIRKTTLVPSSPDHLPVYTLTFAIPRENESSGGRAMAHSKVRLDMGDVVKMVIPNYKPKSYSISALRRDEFDVTLKVYPNGRASGFLDRLTVGDQVHSFGMSAGRLYNPGQYVGIIVYGVGITEGLPVARAELAKGNAQKVVLLWASRTMDDTFWNEDIETLAQQYPSKFEMKHILSREKRGGCLHGRINPEVLKMVFKPTNPEQARFLSVGTKDMMRTTDHMLQNAGFPMPQQALLPKNEDQN